MLLDDVSIIFSQSDFSFSNLHNNQLFQLPLCVTEVHKELVKASCTLEHCCCIAGDGQPKKWPTITWKKEHVYVYATVSYQYNSWIVS